MKKIDMILGLPKSIIFNLRFLPLRQAVKLPIWVSFRTKLKKTNKSGRILINGRITTGMIRFGLTGSGTALYTPSIIENNGTLVFNGRVYFGGGCQICTVKPSSVIEIGDGTRFMGDSHIVSAKKITIGSNCAISWETQIMDTDFHEIYRQDNKINEDKEINIGNHVWIASHVLVMKGSQIGDNIVIASGSMINTSCECDTSNSIITGLPFKIIKSDIDWQV